MAIPLKTSLKNPPAEGPHDLSTLLEVMGINQASPETFIESIPFSLNDTTAGSENEFQTCVIGKRGGG